ncbi:MAG: class I SAM-dependent methyltransferase family protein, partial [Promethearchaeota archaeon]
SNFFMVYVLENLSSCVYINKQQGEKLRNTLLALELLDKNKIIKVEGDFIYFPILKELEGFEKSGILKNFNSAKFKFTNFKLREKTDQSKFLDDLAKYFDQNELKFIPRSFDIIGKIAILEIPSEIQTKEKLLAKLLLEHNKALESVFTKIGKVDGEFRIRDLKYLAGKNNTVTIHKENGCKYELDIGNVYFSPRLSTEHARIADITNSNELILDMFAGIGPFSILIAKKKGATVFSIDKNEKAIFYLKRNIILNKVENLVVPLLGDAQELILDSLLNKFDRIIMNLPSESFNYLPVACKALKSKGGYIHFYMFKTESETYETVEQQIRNEIRKIGRQISNLTIKKVKSTAPYEYQICIDIKIDKI